MKLTFQFIFSIFLALIQAVDNSQSCFSKLTCKLTEARQRPEFNTNFERCINNNLEDRNKRNKCIYKTYGMKDKQGDFFENMGFFFKQCNPFSEDSVRSCSDKCSDEINGDCFQKCGEIYQLIEGTCLAKLANKPNFDVKKSIQCANSCNQATVSEVFDCDYNCMREVYDYLINKSNAETSDKPSSSQESKSKENPSNKNSNQSNSTNTNSSEDGSSNNDPSHANSSSAKHNQDSSTKKDPKSSTSTQSGTPGHSGAILSFGSTDFYKLLFTVALSVLF